MERGITDKTALETFAQDFVRVLDTNGIKYVIVSGFVAIMHGRSRATEDIDIILERVDKKEFIKLHEGLIGKGFHCIQNEPAAELYEEYLAHGLGIRYVKKGTYVPDMEVKLASDEIDERQIKARKKLPFTGLELYFSSPETNIAFKEELLKSQKDMEDARHLRIIYSDAIDEKEIERIKKDIRRLRLK